MKTQIGEKHLCSNCTPSLSSEKIKQTELAFRKKTTPTGKTVPSCVFRTLSIAIPVAYLKQQQQKAVKYSSDHF